MRRHQWRLVVAIITAFIGTTVFLPGLIGAGNLEPSGPPGPTMHTLDEIYSILVDTNSKVTGGSCEGDPVAKTGQETSYEPGDDGDLQKGVTWPNPRFTDNGDGTVTDNLTGLIWTKDANIYGDRTWSEAVSDCAACSVGGYTDWYLPNLRELLSLSHYGFDYPAVPDTAGTGQWSQGDPFDNLDIGQGPWGSLPGFWSSTPYVLDGQGDSWAWLWWSENGCVSHGTHKSLEYRVWCVRGGTT